VTHIRLCPACWLKVAPLISRAALNERDHLKMIARKLTRCPDCALQAMTLRLLAVAPVMAGDC